MRNTFNKRIVEQMLRDHLLEGDKELWRFKDYISGSKNNTRGSEDDNTHPINLWHTPLPFNKGEDVRATKINSQLMGIFLKLNVAMAYICLCFTANFVTILLLD